MERTKPRLGTKTKVAKKVGSTSSLLGDFSSHRLLDWLYRAVLPSVVLLVVLQPGCRITRDQAFERMAAIASLGPSEVVTVKPARPQNWINKTKTRFAAKPQPSERTVQLLRKYDLLGHYQENPARVFEWLQEFVVDSVNLEEFHALAELAEIEANWLMVRGRRQDATHYYGTAVIYSYQFLFNNRLDLARNAYDPQFRSISDIYNRSLGGLLREVCETQRLVPGQPVSLGRDGTEFEFFVELAGRWKDQTFERFEIASDYRVLGFANRYQTFGLGVPLIAVRESSPTSTNPLEQYYPPELTLALTAFGHLRPDPENPDSGRMQAVVTLFDPLENSTVVAQGKSVPLESDITTPLAYNLRNPVVNTGVLATASLINAELAPELYGMYMLEPYDPNKIPVVMVHGLWSSPITWAKMFNDLRANPLIRANYQFWFYSYPTGQPFWFSARRMRQDLKELQQLLDPDGRSAELQEMVLVGHSMGGLISLMQTIDSDNLFWSMISDSGPEEFSGEPAAVDLLEETFFFTANPNVKRVITIASPFQGSEFATPAIRWTGRKLFTLPEEQRRLVLKIVRQNAAMIKSQELLTTATSLDSLASDATIFNVLDRANANPQTVYHNIFGQIPARSWFPKSNATPGEGDGEGDGIVSIESARHHRAVSHRAVPEEHSDIHQHPNCILEIERILLDSLAEKKRIRQRNIPLFADVEFNPMVVDSLDLADEPNGKLSQEPQIGETPQQVIRR